MNSGVDHTEASVRVMTLNLWGLHGDRDDRRTVLANGLRELRPDLVAFQEALTRDGYDQATDLLGPGYRVIHQTMGLLGDGNHGASIAGRWPLGEVREADLRVSPRAADYACGTLIAEVLASDPLGRMVFVAHGPACQWDAELEREMQAVAAARLVEGMVEEAGPHVVAAGDFNATPDASSVRFWTGRQSLDGTSVCYQDAWERTHRGEPGYTFTPDNPLVPAGEMPLEPGRRIDYVMVRCGSHGPTLDVSSCELAFDEPVGGVWASDHFGVVADLQVPRG